MINFTSIIANITVSNRMPLSEHILTLKYKSDVIGLKVRDKTQNAYRYILGRSIHDAIWLGSRRDMSPLDFMAYSVEISDLSIDPTEQETK